ncbi:MAG: type IV pilin protein [Pseudomonadota bacterium]
MTSKLRGFSLIEVLIALTILGILTTIAIPTYSGYVQRNRRSDAINTLLSLQLGQERWRTTHPTYTDLVTDIAATATSSQGYYTVVLSTPASDIGFTITASPAVGSPQTADTKCPSFTISQSGPVIADAQDRTCWNL